MEGEKESGCAESDDLQWMVQGVEGEGKKEGQVVIYTVDRRQFQGTGPRNAIKNFLVFIWALACLTRKRQMTFILTCGAQHSLEHRSAITRVCCTRARSIFSSRCTYSEGYG